ncbi:MAG: hypothetical protein IAE81_01275 [Caldilineaceae bacterium]|nr:hypothetical protein [Caldilineaceae bacterium]
MRIYLDSWIVIYLVEEHPVFLPPIRRATTTAGAAQFCISPLVELDYECAQLWTNDDRLMRVAPGEIINITAP